MRIILASTSPRKSAIMNLAEIPDFEVLGSDKEEKKDMSLSLEDMSIDIAYQKAKVIFDNTQGDRAVIAADTLVIKDDDILGKPHNWENACAMLRKISGTTHDVYTSLCILIEDGGEYKEYKELSKTKIEVKELSEDEIKDYVNKEEPFDKAGAYAIQSSFCKFIKRIDGDYMSVVGLPINRVYEILKENEII